MSREASGLRAWYLQRLTAIYLGLYLVAFLVMLVTYPPQSHTDWVAWLAGPFSSLATMLLVLSLLLHAWIGVRDVLIDYVKPIAIKLVMLSLFLLYLVACGLWAARILLTSGVG